MSVLIAYASRHGATQGIAERIAADGSVASFCTGWFDDVSLTAYLEPVATVSAHRRRGLARAVILEALHRLQ